jgi:hypothetical protein
VHALWAGTDRIQKVLDGTATTRVSGACPTGGPTTLAACRQVRTTDSY